MRELNPKGIEKAAEAIGEVRGCEGVSLCFKAGDGKLCECLSGARAAIAAYLDVVEGELAGPCKREALARVAIAARAKEHPINSIAAAEAEGRKMQADACTQLADGIATEFAMLAARTDESFANGRCFGAATVAAAIRDAAAKIGDSNDQS